jgi:predicted DNA-binding WGR domain protein
MRVIVGAMGEKFEDVAALPEPQRRRNSAPTILRRRAGLCPGAARVRSNWVAYPGGRPMCRRIQATGRRRTATGAASEIPLERKLRRSIFRLSSRRVDRALNGGPHIAGAGSTPAEFIAAEAQVPPKRWRRGRSSRVKHRRRINRFLESVRVDRFNLFVGRPQCAHEECAMAADIASKLQLVLERRRPEKNMARFYVLTIEPTLFGDSALVREWGRLGAGGRRRIDLHENDGTAREALELWLKRKQRRGYCVRG